MKTKTKLKVGDIVIVLQGAFPHNDYAGFMAKVEYCKTCCKNYRLQMLGIGNSANLSACDQNKLYKIIP